MANRSIHDVKHANCYISKRIFLHSIINSQNSVILYRDLKMKKHILPLSLAAVAMLGAASVSAQTTRTWDGGGSTESYFEADNWSGNTVPTAVDNIVFNATSSKICRMDASVTVNNITVAAAYSGSIHLTDSGTTLTANNITVNGAYFQLAPKTGASSANVVTVSNNGWFNTQSSISFTAATLDINPAGYFSAYSLATVNVNVINMDQYSQFKAPEEGKVNLTGSFTKHKNSTYDHRKSTLYVIGNAGQTFNLSPGAGQNNGSCDFWNIVLDKNNETSNGTDNMNVSATDTVIAGNRMTILDGDVAGGFVGISDTLEHVGQGNQGHSTTFYFIGAKNGDILLTGGNTLGSYTYYILKATNTTPVNVWKGGASSVLVHGNSTIDNGDLRFDEDMEATVNGAISVLDNGTLTMPAAEYLNLSNDISATSGGTIAHRMGTLNFMGTGSRDFDFGSPKRFYDIEFNMPASGAALRPLGGNDTMIAEHNLKLVTGYMAGGTGPAILLVEGDMQALSSMSTSNDWAYSIAFTGSNNSNYTAEVGVPMPTGIGSAGIVVNKSSAGAKVIVGAGSASFATVGVNSNVYVQSGILELPDDCRLNLKGDNAAGLNVTGGSVSAPSGDLYVRGAWNFYGPGAFTHNSGNVILTGTSSDEFRHNNQAVKFNNVEIRTHAMEWGTVPSTTTDTLWVVGDLSLTNSGDLVNVSLVFEGDFTTVGSGSTPVLDEKAIAAGSADQIVTLGGVSHLEVEGLMINKTAGAVHLGSDVRLDQLTLKNGNIVPGAFVFTVDGPNHIIGGTNNSFIDGKLFITCASQWAGSRYLLPIGRGTNFRPVQLHNSSSVNNWNVEYIPNDTSSAGSLSGGLDEVSSTEYWLINRTSGGSGTFSNTNNTFVELSIAGKDGSWADADVRVTRLVGADWTNLGNAVVSDDRVRASTGTLHNNQSGVFTIARETPAPVRTINGIEVSGQEVNTSADKPGVAATAANSAVSFQVFPNPVNETLNFSVAGSDNGTVTLSDLSGKVIGVYNVAEVRSISVSNLAAGVYFATYTNGVNRIAHRVIKF